jgi:hypothetical protein
VEFFQKLVADAEKEYKPYYDYSKHEDKDLLVFYALFKVWGCQCVVRILHMKGLAPFTNETHKKLSELSDNPSPENLAYLHSINPDTRPLKALVWLKLDRNNIWRELDKRHRSFKVGRAFILMEEGKWQPKDVTEFHKLLKVKKIPSYRPEKEDAGDLKSEAVTKALEFFKTRGETVRVKERPGMPMPAMPQEWGLPARDPDLWGLWHRDIVSWFIDALCKDYLSLFFGRVDRTKEAARQALRNHWEKWEAQKRSGKEVSLEQADKTSPKRSSSGVWRKQGERVEEKDKPDISERMFEVLRVAKQNKRWGDKAVKAFKYYLEGKTEKEAAKLAGITEKTFRNYTVRLRKIFASKK